MTDSNRELTRIYNDLYLNNFEIFQAIKAEIISSQFSYFMPSMKLSQSFFIEIRIKEGKGD